eukprot:CAMPEP_0178930856 /NCGR_PEP_ID=MMETSP0786-20121207/21547_1 /TAXON_ID=186022 /ORGANISM="Thalassionema frauenfeldii, Strain CCMP 1798" /LENGTH=84 /DNA_ID=CAMNT_0020607589 /DNA_START=8 /DNA_END=259 /DNA_ORIENTATION=-
MDVGGCPFYGTFGETYNAITAREACCFCGGGVTTNNNNNNNNNGEGIEGDDTNGGDNTSDNSSGNTITNPSPINYKCSDYADWN